MKVGFGGKSVDRGGGGGGGGERGEDAGGILKGGRWYDLIAHIHSLIGLQQRDLITILREFFSFSFCFSFFLSLFVSFSLFSCFLLFACCLLLFPFPFFFFFFPIVTPLPPRAEFSLHLKYVHSFFPFGLSIFSPSSSSSSFVLQTTLDSKHLCIRNRWLCFHYYLYTIFCTPLPKQAHTEPYQQFDR